MTAEIGIMNRMGVALAADSAVTIGAEGMSKVYNSANKLFALSKHHPVGIMIYGGASFMSVPWETIIKTYREALGEDKRNTLKEYCDDFMNFVKTDLRLQNQLAEKILVQRIFLEAFLELLAKIEVQINEHIATHSTIPTQVTVEGWISTLTGSFTKNIKVLRNVLPIFGTNFHSDFKNQHELSVFQVIDERMSFTLNQTVKDQLFDLAYNIVVSDIFSNNSSGIVIAGYGEEEIFPSMYEYNFEGIINGTLKMKENNPTLIGAVGDGTHKTSAITPFAQKDMVQSFMRGIDPLLESKLSEILENILNEYPNLVEQRIVTKLTPQDKDEIKKLGGEILSSFHDELVNVQDRTFMKPIVDIVDVLPKEELAAMAEALVNLTSFKRRVSIQADTVGGPVDVAVITKGDGLIWIKRKHYFKPELNYHFFQNYMRSE